MAKSPNKLSASEAILRMSQKRLKARDLVEACLDRIELREGQVHAWEALDAEGARKRADMLDKRARPVGPLHGIPLAVKDIISTKTMPTTCGSPIYRDHVAGRDAACVTQLVNAGAIVLGKSVTTNSPAPMPARRTIRTISAIRRGAPPRARPRPLPIRWCPSDTARRPPAR